MTLLNKLKSAVRESIWTSAGGLMRDSVADPVWNSVLDSVWNSVLDSVSAPVRNSVLSSVQHPIGEKLKNYDFTK